MSYSHQGAEVLRGSRLQNCSWGAANVSGQAARHGRNEGIVKAVVTTGEKGKVVVKEVPDPPVQPRTLLIKVKYVAICGSDLEYLEGTFGRGPQAGIALGHEFSGEVVEVGEGVEGWLVGDRVSYSGSFQRPCGVCYFCRRRLHHLCVCVSPECELRLYSMTHRRAMLV